MRRKAATSSGAIIIIILISLISLLISLSESLSASIFQLSSANRNAILSPIIIAAQQVLLLIPLRNYIICSTISKIISKIISHIIIINISTSITKFIIIIIKQLNNIKWAESPTFFSFFFLFFSFFFPFYSLYL